MRASRNLPDDLALQLRRARTVESAAESLQQERRAAAGTGTLMLAAVEAGWMITDIAKAMGLRVNTASKRVRDARALRSGSHVGLVVDRPARISGPLAELEVPAGQRQWLTRREAADYLGVDGHTVHGYFRYGLLPNSRKISGTWRLYLCADLDRVRNGPRRGSFLDRNALRERLAAHDESGSVHPQSSTP